MIHGRIAAVAVLFGGAAAVPAADFAPPGVAPGSREDHRAAAACLAAAVGYEAGSESLLGQQAVAQVVLNRLRHPAFPKTVCGVVYQGAERATGCQFTFTCDGSLRQPRSLRSQVAAAAVAEQALAGRLPPTIGAATHYHADYVRPRWAPALVRVGAIGAHIFYRFPGSADAREAAASMPGGSRPAPAVASAVDFRPWGLAVEPPAVR